MLSQVLFIRYFYISALFNFVVFVHRHELLSRHAFGQVSAFHP